MELPILTTNDIKKYDPCCFIIYSDNILEGTNVLDLLSTHNKFLDIVGVSYEPIDQPVYLFKDKDSDLFFCVKVSGKYENWKLSTEVNSIIHFIDKPDFVFVDASSNKGVFVGEMTGTANVGNSQWQREGRKISAARNGIPMIYQTYYSGTDRSKFGQNEIDSGNAQGQIRQPTSLQSINHFIYSIRYRTPSLVIYYPNNEYDRAIGFKRSNLGSEYIKHYISICLLYHLNKRHKTLKKKIEYDIYMRMLEYITEKVNIGHKKIQRIDKDFPIEPINTNFKKHGNKFVHLLVDYINGDVHFNEILNITNWDYKSFVPWNHRYNKTHLINLLQKAKIPIFSYLGGVTKVGIVLDSSKLIKLLISNYTTGHKSNLNPKIPTLIIPTLMFQKKDDKYIHKVDPGTGEIVAFSELFARDIKNCKTMNIIIYVHVKGPDKFSTATKLFRAIRQYADCLIINEKVYEI
jgi:hypothetical protein